MQMDLTEAEVKIIETYRKRVNDIKFKINHAKAQYKIRLKKKGVPKHQIEELANKQYGNSSKNIPFTSNTKFVEE